LTLLDRLIAQRAQHRDQLMSMSQSDDITSRLLSNTQSDEEIYASELSKYSEIQSKVQQSYAQQADLLNKIQKDNTQFVSSKQSGNPNAQREQILQQLTTAFKVYTELKSNLREGIQFYTNFQEILRQFSRKCEDFALARQTEKQDLIGELQKQQTTGPQSIPQSFGTTPVNNFSVQGKPVEPQQMPGQWQPNMQPVYQAPQQFMYQPPTSYQQAPYQQPPYQQPPYQQPPYQQPPYQQPPYQQPPYGFPQGYQNPYGQQPYPNNQQKR